MTTARGYDKAMAKRQADARDLMRQIYSTKLTPRQRAVLDYCYRTSLERGGDDGEVVTEGRVAWIGSSPTSPALVARLLRLMALEPIDPDTHDGRQSSYRAFTITQIGIDLLLGNPPRLGDWC